MQQGLGNSGGFGQQGQPGMFGAPGFQGWNHPSMGMLSKGQGQAPGGLGSRYGAFSAQTPAPPAPAHGGAQDTRAAPPAAPGTEGPGAQLYGQGSAVQPLGSYVSPFQTTQPNFGPYGLPPPAFGGGSSPSPSVPIAPAVSLPPPPGLASASASATAGGEPAPLLETATASALPAEPVPEDTATVEAKQKEPEGAAEEKQPEAAEKAERAEEGGEEGEKKKEEEPPSEAAEAEAEEGKGKEEEGKAEEGAKAEAEAEAPAAASEEKKEGGEEPAEKAEEAKASSAEAAAPAPPGGPSGSGPAAGAPLPGRDAGNGSPQVPNYGLLAQAGQSTYRSPFAFNSPGYNSGLSAFRPPGGLNRHTSPARVPLDTQHPETSTPVINQPSDAQAQLGQGELRTIQTERQQLFKKLEELDKREREVAMSELNKTQIGGSASPVPGPFGPFGYGGNNSVWQQRSPFTGSSPSATSVSRPPRSRSVPSIGNMNSNTSAFATPTSPTREATAQSKKASLSPQQPLPQAPGLPPAPTQGNVAAPAAAQTQGKPQPQRPMGGAGPFGRSFTPYNAAQRYSPLPATTGQMGGGAGSQTMNSRMFGRQSPIGGFGNFNQFGSGGFGAFSSSGMGEAQNNPQASSTGNAGNLSGRGAGGLVRSGTWGRH